MKQYNNVLQEVKLIDPSMGSGHILVYAFEVFLQLYEAEGESTRTAVEFILQKNLFGLDIDKRAFQLAYFALMMKGRQYNRRILIKNIELNIYALSDDFGISIAELQLLHLTFPNDEKGQQDLLNLVEGFKNACDLGSLIEFNGIDFDNLKEGLKKETISLVDFAIHAMISTGELLQQKYDIVVTNPPYMGSSSFNATLSKFSKKKFSESKNDLFAMFIVRWNNSVRYDGYNAMVTMQSWMFLSSYEKMRKSILENYTINNLMHMDNMVMGIAFGTAVTIFHKKYIQNFKGTYHQIKFVDVSKSIPKTVPIEGNRFNQVSQNEFKKIPGSPISYWVSEKIYSLFATLPLLQEIAAPKSGLATGNNDLFQKRWFEIDFKTIGFNYRSTIETKGGNHKWFPENSGGEHRKWYPTNEYVVDWKDDGKNIRSYRNEKGKLGARPQNTQFYFKEGVTWNKLSSSKFGVRFKEAGFIFDDTSRSLFANDTDDTMFLTGYLCSSVVFNLLKILNPTMSFTNNDLARIPVNMNLSNNSSVNEKTKCNIELVKNFDSQFEEFWSFKKHPLK